MKTPTALAAALALVCVSAWAQRPGGPGGGMDSRAGGPRPGVSPGGQQGWGGHHGGAGGFNRTPTPGVRSFPTPGYFGFGSPHGYGNVVFPGTYSPFSIVDPTFGTRLFNNVSGFGYPYAYGGGYGSGTVVLPYSVPVYVPYAAPVVVPPVAPTQIIYIVQGEPDRSMTTPAPPSNTGSVITYVVPARENAPAATATARKLYLIAFKSGSIYSATEYWMEEETLHYVTSYGARNQASLDQLDLELTVRLNRERGLDFRLDK